jgi:prepilin-type N-terminal cleavage/methylation domain-containing protein
MMRPRVRNSGFTLYEVMVGILILVIFFAVAGKLFNSVILLGAASENLSNASSRTDSALFRLRADVWDSKSIVVADARSITLTRSDGSQIVWTLTPDEGISRAGPTAKSEQWEGIGKGWAFSTDAVSLTVAENKEVPVRLVSQVLISRRMPS